MSRSGRALSCSVVLVVLSFAILSDAQTALRFVPVSPCRTVDTRWPTGQFGGPAIAGGTYRSFALPDGPCQIPATAVAYSLNVTAVPRGHLGYLTIWPAG